MSSSWCRGRPDRLTGLLLAWSLVGTPDRPTAERLGSGPQSMVCTRTLLSELSQSHTWCNLLGPPMPESQEGRLRTQTELDWAPFQSRRSGKGHRQSSPHQLCMQHTRPRCSARSPPAWYPQDRAGRPRSLALQRSRPHTRSCHPIAALLRLDSMFRWRSHCSLVHM